MCVREMKETRDLNSQGGLGTWIANGDDDDDGRDKKSRGGTTAITRLGKHSRRGQCQQRCFAE